MYWSLNSQSQLNYVSDIKYFFNKILRLKRKHEFEGSIKTEKGTKQKKAKKKINKFEFTCIHVCVCVCVSIYVNEKYDSLI